MIRVKGEGTDAQRIMNQALGLSKAKDTGKKSGPSLGESKINLNKHKKFLTKPPKTTIDLPTGPTVYINGKTQRRKEEDSDADSDFDVSDDDTVMAMLRAKRLQQLQAKTGKTAEFRALGHGEYQLVAQDEFLAAVTKSKYVVCHFFHSEFERCKIMDKHLNILAPRHLPTRFIMIDANKSPFFVEKLAIRVIPTLVIFKDGVAIERMVGFEDLGSKDDFSTALLQHKLAVMGVLIGQKRRQKGDALDNDSDSASDSEEKTYKSRSIRSGNKNIITDF